MTAGDKADEENNGKKKSKEEAERNMTMDEAAAKLLKGQAPARWVVESGPGLLSRLCPLIRHSICTAADSGRVSLGQQQIAL
jgi:hypothetical protein